MKPRSRERLRPTDSVSRLPGIGPKRQAMLEKAGLTTIFRLLCYRPMRYEDRRHFATVSSLSTGRPVLLHLSVVSSRMIWTRRKDFSIVEAFLEDATGTVKVFWFNRPYLARNLSAGRRLVLLGELSERGGSRIIRNPEYELLDADEEASGSLHFGRIVPVYRRLTSLSGKGLRKLMGGLLESAREGGFPPKMLEDFGKLHFPDDLSEPEEARRRLSYRELFRFQQGLLLQRRSFSEGLDISPAVKEADRTLARLEGIAPFRLTGGQRGALSQVLTDMAKSRPMRRLLHGEVGSGKTIIALLSALAVIEAGRQTAIMAPTELLAHQLWRKARHLFEQRAGVSVPICLLTASTRGDKRRQIEKLLGDGKPLLVVGTHALLSERTSFGNLGYVIVDEQHRFGVAQRQALLLKGKRSHFLVMTATPIPRTLTLTLYGDLDVSKIRRRPAGRGIVSTRVLRYKERLDAYEEIERVIRRRRQAFLIVPLIAKQEEGEIVRPHAKRKRRRASVEAIAADLRKKRPGWRIATMHGKMSGSEKAAVGAALYGREVDLLVATTVVEVGIDIPSVASIVVLSAESYGLSQLHQLRGRAGRGPRERASCFFVLSKNATQDCYERIEILETTTDGFRVAELDWGRRGPGNPSGYSQYGKEMFGVADLVQDGDLVKKARSAAQRSVSRMPRERREALLAAWCRDYLLAEVG